MLKVANVIMEGRYGGPQACIALVAEKLKLYGIQTVVILPKQESVFFLKKLREKKIVSKQLTLHRITKDIKSLIGYCIFFIPELLSLYRIFKSVHANVIHCNHSWQVKGVLAAKLARKPVVWTIHETYMPPFINMIFKLLALNFCDTFITAGGKVKEYYFSDKRFSQKQIVEIQAPVDTSVFDPSKVKEDYQIASYPGLKIVTVGNINPLKGIEYLIKMASILNKEYDDLNFFVVGPHYSSQQKYSEKIRKMVKNLKLINFHFYGQTDSVSSVLKAADIYVCSSISEASPVAVWEAMSMAKPIVSTDVGDVARFIKNGENGFVVPIRDAVGLADKMRELIQNKELREEMGQKSRIAAVQYLDIDICTKKHVVFYKQLI